MHFIDDFLDGARKQASLEKDALLSEAARAGVKALGKGPAQQKAVGRAVESFLKRRVQRPIKSTAWKAVSKLEAPATTRLRQAGGSRRPTELQRKLMRGVRLVAQNPEVIPLQAVPVPGATLAWMGTKKGLEKGLRAYAP
jgi:hypothetical protein